MPMAIFRDHDRNFIEAIEGILYEEGIQRINRVKGIIQEIVES